MSDSPRLIGPFRQVLPMTDLPLKGAIQAEQLPIVPEAGILIQGEHITRIDSFETLREGLSDHQIDYLEGDYCGTPGLVDAHTHICFAGSRARDYAMRVSGKSYQEIAAQGGGIWDSVQQTRSASQADLEAGIVEKIKRHSREGVTTCEVKSGYGLSVDAEIKMLKAIHAANHIQPVDLIPTCLAAHICPKDFQADASVYLSHLIDALLPRIQAEQLSQRIDIFIETGAFSPEIARTYLGVAKDMGFDLTVHADQFHPGGSQVAVELGAVSADHLEASGEKEIALLAQSDVIAMALPGASLGLGEPFAPARALLDAGACVAIASDWNPGSAPMGDLLIQAALLGVSEHLSIAETLAGMTYRAAAALRLSDRGTLASGKLADILAFPSADHRDIFYYQGKMKPQYVWKRGNKI